MRYSRCWETMHKALQHTLGNKTIGADPCDARLLWRLVEDGEADTHLIVEEAYALLGKDDCTSRQTLEAQLERLLLTAS